jgi:hypothetical protein
MEDSSRLRRPEGLSRPGPDSGDNPYSAIVPKLGEPGAPDEHATARPDPGDNPYGIMVPKFGSHVKEPGTDHDGAFTIVPPKFASFTLSELRSFITTPPSSPPSEHSFVCNTSGDDPFINATSMLPSTPMDDAKMRRFKKKKQKKKADG